MKYQLILPDRVPDGRCKGDSDQAPLAYQKAISSKPDHPLAWQGLANYYERKEDISIKPKLFPIYSEILNLPIEEEKALEIINKLGQLGCSLRDNESITILLKYLGKDLNQKLRTTAEKQLLDILKANIHCKEEDIDEVYKVLNEIYSKDPSESLEVLQGKIILQKRDFVAAVEQVTTLKCFSSNVLLREYLCKFLCQKYVEYGSFSNINIESKIEKITERIENSKYPGLLKCMIMYENGEYLEAYKQCVPLINYQDADSTEATFIIKCTMQLKKWSIMQKLATNFLTKAKDLAFILELRKYLFISLAKQQKWKEAISATKDVPSDNLSKSELAMLAECYIEMNEPPVNNIMEQLKDTECYIQLQALTLLKQKKYTDVVNLLDNSTDSMLCLFYLGQAYWELKQYDKCLIILLKAAKMDNEHAETFLYLGHYYHHHKQDLEKAKKCYEKAYSINNTDASIVKSLSEIYTKLSLKDEDFELLNTAQKNVQTNEPWIHFRIGLHHLNKRDWENAIISFRNVIKSDQNNTTAFECLADAYYSRGSFTSALRAYNKVMTLNPDHTSHCLTRMGYIYSLLTQYDEAITTFERVLQIDPSSLLALKGIAETWVKIAKKKESSKLYGSARDCAQNAINFITKALSKQKQYSCLWKLMADTLIAVTKLPNKYAYVYIKDGFDESKEASRKEKLEIFPQAIAAYSYIAKQKQQLASYDLASAYLDYYHESKNIVNCNISFNLTITCIKEKPSSWRNWNLLGKICLFIKKYNVAQHCFIKALLLTRKWSVAKIWCNLGTLYVKLKLYKMANYCFWRGQSTLPSYPQSWIGQALIAEQIREEEAMDLFRHACRLGYHPESALGYADWVCRTLKNQNYPEDPESKYVIEGLHAIPYAMDLMEWLCTFDPNNACACTILGILQERSGLLHAAIKSHEKALQYADDDKKNISLLNIGRLLVRLERYDEAVKVFKAITEASLNSAAGLALALFKKGLYEESYSAYDTALHWLSNDDDEKADLLIAMAGIVYLFKGADEAKTLLFHSIQVSQKKPTAFSLFAICSLGIIHSDQSLSKLALGELKKYEKDDKYGFDTGFLKSYIHVSQDNVEEAIKILSDSLHDHPSNALLWYCMAQYCLRASNRARIASCCAQRALCTAHYNECQSEPAKLIATASVAEHIAGNPKKALALAKQGLHMYPQQAEIWAALLFSLLPHKKWTEKKDWILGAAGYMRRQLDTSRPLIKWVNLVEKRILSVK
ncbi:tetratricopeptide repeat domain-containing protein [Phthorimaea operculella]|nr:tetratricopeptide repeat domain-containing protein [Phthorimaea operculella]